MHLQVKFEVGHVKQHSPTPLPPKQTPTSNPKEKPLPRRPNPKPPKPCKQNEHKTCRDIFRNILALEESQWFPGVPDFGSDYSRCCRLSGDRYFEPVLTHVKCLFYVARAHPVMVVDSFMLFWDAKMRSRLANLSSQEDCQRLFLQRTFAISCQILHGTSQEAFPESKF